MFTYGRLIRRRRQLDGRPHIMSALAADMLSRFTVVRGCTIVKSIMSEWVGFNGTSTQFRSLAPSLTRKVDTVHYSKGQPTLYKSCERRTLYKFRVALYYLSFWVSAFNCTYVRRAVKTLSLLLGRRQLRLHYCSYNYRRWNYAMCVAVSTLLNFIRNSTSIAKLANLNIHRILGSRVHPEIPELKNRPGIVGSLIPTSLVRGWIQRSWLTATLTWFWQPDK